MGKVTELTSEDVPALERGMALLGSGGGGDTAVPAALLHLLLRNGRRVQIGTVGELAPHDRVVGVGVVGSPVVFVEKIPGGNEFRDAISMLTRWTSCTPTAVMSIEGGGVNGLMVVAIGILLDLPIVDADLSGRAVPRLDQFSLAVAGDQLTPLVLAQSADRGSVLLEGGRPDDVERTVRRLLAEGVGWAAAAVRPLNPTELGSLAIHGTIARALKIGRLSLAGEWETLGEVVGSGRIFEVGHVGGDGLFGRGWIALCREDGAVVRVEMENEYLAVLIDGQPAAAPPDIIAVVDHRTGSPVACHQARSGTAVRVVRLLAPEFWNQPGNRAALADDPRWPHADDRDPGGAR